MLESWSAISQPHLIQASRKSFKWIYLHCNRKMKQFIIALWAKIVQKSLEVLAAKFFFQFIEQKWNAADGISSSSSVNELKNSFSELKNSDLRNIYKILYYIFWRGKVLQLLLARNCWIGIDIVSFFSFYCHGWWSKIPSLRLGRGNEFY